jgi:hypothetical protein
MPLASQVTILVSLSATSVSSQTKRNKKEIVSTSSFPDEPRLQMVLSIKVT